MARKKSSQQEIAAHLGVSQGLVSMVLNGRSQGINPATYRRIWDHAVSVGYAPKGMRVDGNGSGERANQVGFLLRAGLTLHTQSNFFSHVQHGLHNFLRERGQSSLYLGTETTLSGEGFRDLEQMQSQVSGIAIMGEVDLAFLKKVRRIFSKVVSISSSYPGLCHSVVNNESQSIDQLVDHLYSLGHRSFGWIGMGDFRRLKRHSERFNAFQEALSRHDCQCPPEAVGSADGGDRMEGRLAARQLVDRVGLDNLPSAWVAYNGLMARGAANLLISRQIEIPGEVSIAAVDGTRVCFEEEPTLTGAFTDPEKMGAKAGELLINASGDPEEIFQDLVLPSVLSVRESTGRAPASRSRGVATGAGHSGNGQ